LPVGSSIDEETPFWDFNEKIHFYRLQIGAMEVNRGRHTQVPSLTPLGFVV
jgi:hypothetical protein